MTTPNEIASGAFEVAATVGDALARSPDPTTAAIGAATAVLGRVVAALVKDVGAEEATRIITELHKRKNEGLITDGDIAADDEAVFDEIRTLFDKPEDEHPDDA